MFQLENLEEVKTVFAALCLLPDESKINLMKRIKKYLAANGQTDWVNQCLQDGRERHEGIRVKLDEVEHYLKELSKELGIIPQK